MTNEKIERVENYNDLRFCEGCGDVLSDDEDEYCKRCEYLRKRKIRRRIIAGVVTVAGVAAVCWISYNHRREIAEKTANARTRVTETVKKIPIDKSITVIKRAGGAAGDKLKEVRIMIDDKVSGFRK